MTYLITGGAGFIGSHLALALLRRGEAVVVLDNLNDYYDPAIKKANLDQIQQFPSAEIVIGDIRDMDVLRNIFAGHTITHVAHMAAMAGVRASVDETPLYVDVNVRGTMNILELCRDYDVRQFVMASTSSVYGKTDILPFVETDTADRPLASYPASKRAAEILAYTYHNLNDLQVTILRFFNVYGPAGRPDMMPMRLMKATQDGTEIPYFNNGDIHRDWTYIDDTVNGILTALERPLGYEIMNLGVGSPISLADFVEIIEEYSGKTIHKIPVEAPLSDPPITFCNNEKARRLLDFDPQVSVQEGLRRTWDWFIKQPPGNKISQTS